MTAATAFTQHEVAIVYLSRMVEEGKSYWTPGGGRPGFSVSLAQRLHAPNVMRMTEEGCIGGVAQNAFSLMGYQGFPPDTTAWEETYGPEIAHRLKQEGVSCVLLTPA